MTPPVPNIDTRTAGDVATQVVDLIRVYAPAWKEVDPATGQATGVSGALIGIFSRFAEIIIQRLNQVPQKNFIAFLDLLGATRLPPQPARVPLTFFLAAGSTADGLVPAGTQVAAPPGEGEKDPVIFETEHALTVIAAQLASLFVRDPKLDKYSERSEITATPSEEGALVFRGDRRIEHVFYIAHGGLLGFPIIENLSLTFDVASPPRDARLLQWEVWNGAGWQNITPPSEADLTQYLQKSGMITFGPAAAVPPAPVNGVQNRWLRGRLLTPITSFQDQQVGMERASRLPLIWSLQMTVVLNRSGLSGETAFTNLLPVDLSKDFLPFGEKPRFSDTFWLAQHETFSVAGATVNLSIVLTNPIGSGNAAPTPVNPSPGLRLNWEVWDGTAWVVMGTSQPGPTQPPGANGFTDATGALTRSGNVSFVLPSSVAAATVNGVSNFWLRVRIVSGDYGQEARYVPRDVKDPGAGYNFFPATFAPPVISSIRLAYSLSKTDAPEAVVTFNDFVYEDVTAINNDPVQSFAPFRPAEDAKPTFYVGFALPPDRAAFPNRTVTLFCQTAEFKYGELTVPLSPETSRQFGAPASTVSHRFVATNAAPVRGTFTFTVFGTSWQPAPASPPPVDLAAGESQEVEVQVAIPVGTPLQTQDRGFLQLENSAIPGIQYTADFVTFAGTASETAERLRLAWEYWDGQRWSNLAVLDGTENFKRPGTIEFLAPPDFSARQEFGQPLRYWLRERWDKGEFDIAPRLRRMLLNTTMAAQTLTLYNQVLGSSDGSAQQKFLSTRNPILLQPNLEVREPEMPSAAEQQIIKAEEGTDAITIVSDTAGRPKEIWVRWHEAPDFYDSGPRSRHYVLDHLTGGIRFGDGINGLIPPVGIGNIRLARYQTGGGSAGNKPAGAIVQLKTTVPYVDKVTNTEPSAGGADAETLDSLLARAPRAIRHGGRSVTTEDYEDVALLTSPEVARAKCVPLRNLVEDPLGQQPAARGEVSLIIVPRSKEAKPLPSLELLGRVEDYLQARSVPTANVSVVGPLYIRVDVKAEVALVSLEGASAVELAIRQKLAAFLHPLTGGQESSGWDFGRKPHSSDIYALIESVPGVDHVRSLAIIETEDEAGVSSTGLFLVFSGTHTISLIFQET